MNNFAKILSVYLMLIFGFMPIKAMAYDENDPGEVEVSEQVLCRVQKGGVFQNFTVLGCCNGSRLMVWNESSSSFCGCVQMGSCAEKRDPQQENGRERMPSHEGNSRGIPGSTSTRSTLRTRETTFAFARSAVCRSQDSVSKQVGW